MGIKFLGKCLVIEDGKEKILVVGDLHLGFEESLNESGILVTRQMFGEVISEFDSVFDSVGKIDKIILLGDVKHAFWGNSGQEWNDVLELFDYFFGRGAREIVVTRGNHDNYLKTIAGKRDVEVVDYYIVGEILFLHGDKIFDIVGDKKVETIVMGHFHPAVNLSDGNKIEKYKCFLEGKWKGKEVIIAPSFIEYSEGSDLREEKVRDVWGFDFGSFDVKVVGEELKVLEFGKLGKLKKIS